VGTNMTRDTASGDDLLRCAVTGDPHALAKLFARDRDRLRRVVRLKLDRRLQGRVHRSDVPREALNGMDMARL
jgi:RNA polymerase sigma-70 factor (ECF subfamily)